MELKRKRPKLGNFKISFNKTTKLFLEESNLGHNAPNEYHLKLFRDNRP